MESFKNRLLKINKHISKWARRQNISCYRIYDRDIPEFPFLIDKYENALNISLFLKEKLLEKSDYKHWLFECIQIISESLNVANENIFLKERIKQKGKSQYNKQSTNKEFSIVSESGLKFLINTTDYLDTGLFLDHRETRNMVRSESNHKNFLNLFAYTGSFTVYAAAGGAKSTTTIDMSYTYLEWAEKNMQLNGFGELNHRFIQGNIMEYIYELPNSSFDLIVVDPPTFSKSKKMFRDFDIQRDHEELLLQVLRTCIKGGIIYFSTNFQKFKPKFENLKVDSIKEITKQTIPKDFRNQKIHKCYKIIK